MDNKRSFESHLEGLWLVRTVLAAALQTAARRLIKGSAGEPFDNAQTYSENKVWNDD
jgi:hypothetical protein